MIALYARLMIVAFLVLLLTLIPMPVGFEMLRPFWGLLFLLYLQFKLPDVFSYIWVVVLGVVLDVLSVAPLGEHLFALCLVAGLSSSRAQRFKFFSLSQQIIWVFFLACVYQVTLSVIDQVLGHRVMVIDALFSLLMTTLIWPVFVMLVDQQVLRVKSASIRKNCL